MQDTCGFYLGLSHEFSQFQQMLGFLCSKQEVGQVHSNCDPFIDQDLVDFFIFNLVHFDINVLIGMFQM